MLLHLLCCRPTGLGRKSLYTFVLFIVACFSTSAQGDFTPKLGVIDRAAVSMTAYPGDSSAGAVVLYDFGKTDFLYDDTRGLVMTTRRWVRIKILKESALDRASVGVIYYSKNTYDTEESIDDLQGYTYNLENGQVVKTEMDSKAVKRENAAEQVKILKFNLPNVKKGSVIEYSYTRWSPMSVRSKPENWAFQQNLPTAWSEYQITIPYFLEYKMTLGGYLPLNINKQEQINLSVGHSRYNGPALSYRFAVKDAPAFVNEPYITTENDYLSRIQFEIAAYALPGQPIRKFSRTWEQVDHTLRESSDFGGELRRSSFINEVKEAILAKAQTPVEKMNMAYQYIQQSIKWNGRLGLWSGDGVRETYNNKKGNVGDINLMLTSLLREVGLESNPIVLSTRSHGKILTEIPMIESFNYVIAHVKIGEKEYMLDATEPYCRPDLLPERALNGTGRLIPRKGAGRFITIAPQEMLTKLDMIQAKIVPEEGTITGSHTTSLGGYEALKWRDAWCDEDDQKVSENVKKGAPEWDITNITVKNKKEDLGQGVRIGYDFEISEDAATSGVLYFNPIMAGRWTSNPLKSADRIYPLDLGTGISNSFIANFELPVGYVVEDIPKGELLTLPDKAGKFIYQVKQTGHVVQVNSLVMVNKLSFTPEEYHDLKEFFERVVQKHSQLLVIKKQAN